MSVEANIQQSAQEVLGRLHSQIEAELNSMVTAFVGDAAADREAAVKDARAAVEAAREAAIADVRASALAEKEAAVKDARAAVHAEMMAAVATAVAAAKAETESAMATKVAAARAEVDGSWAARLTTVRAESESTLARQLTAVKAEAAETLAASLAEVRAGERQAELACMDRLLHAIRALDSAQSLGEVLDVLAEQTRQASGRAAVLLVQGDRLRGWRLAGFSETADLPSNLDVRIDSVGIAEEAIRTGECATTRSAYYSVYAGTQRLLSGFVHLPDDRVGLAVPVRVGGQTVAVLYADDATGQEPCVPSSWPEVVEMFARHAARCLEVLTVAKARSVQTAEAGSPAGLSLGPPARLAAAGAAPDEARTAHDRPHVEDAEEEAARRYARLLISEIKLYNEPVVLEGRRRGDLFGRLGAEIGRARRLYEDRIPLAMRARADYFHEELVRTLAGGDPSLLGKVT